jgi:hypothetical protein
MVSGLNRIFIMFSARKPFFVSNIPCFHQAVFSFIFSKFFVAIQGINRFVVTPCCPDFIPDLELK